MAYLAKNFRKFLKFKRNGKSFGKGKFSKFKKEKKDFKKEKKNFKKDDSRDSLLSQMGTCFECKGHGHVKKECPTYLKAKGKVFALSLVTQNGSNFDSEESCDGEGNYFAFMASAPVDSLEDLSLLVEELGEHIEVEFMGIGEEFDDEDEGTKELQESYNSLLKKSGEYARVAKAAIRKMKKAKQDYKSILVSTRK